MRIKMVKEKFVTNGQGYLERFVKDAEYQVRESVGCRLVNNGEAKYLGECDA